MYRVFFASLIVLTFLYVIFHLPSVCLLCLSFQNISEGDRQKLLDISKITKNNSKMNIAK